MELSYVSLLSVFIVVSLSLHFLFFNKKSSAAAPFPPGNTGWPVIGESFQFLSAGRKGQPEKFIYDRIAEYSSTVFRTHLLGECAAVLCGADGNKFVFSNQDKLLKSWWPATMDKIFPSSSQTSSTGEAATMRKMLPHFLKPDSLRRHVSVMDHIAQRHFADGWDNKKEVVVFPLTNNYAFWVSCRLFISVEDPDHINKFFEPFSKLFSGMVSIPVDLPGTPFNTAIKASNFIRKELIAIIKQRRIDLAEGKATPTQDILSHMLLTCDEDGKFMEELNIADKILGLLLGGYDNPSSACAFTVKYLAELPQVYEAVYKEQMEIANSKKAGELLTWDDIQKMKYSWNVVCEVLRLLPPNPGTFREALTDFIYNGFTIPKGWKIYWSAYSTHLNPECFPNPKKFDPSRFEGTGPAPYTFVPFGGGPKMCPGKEFARLEILVFVHNIVKRFRWEKMIPNEKIVVNPMPAPAKGLPIRLYPHTPTH